MKTHNIDKTLSKIIEEEKTICIVKSGKRIAEIKRVEEEKKKIPWGRYEDKIWLAEDWDSDEINEQIAKGYCS